ncbi:MAG: YesL family protein [Clostridium sp.]|uniref:YesL family protein n=1 Tax=Faecalicatena contorta TaxID=39482 RepID=UPI001896B0F4|nr:YesL family protein [Faecalicatena contorta]MBS6766004.1 YesL family protein [Clostridium sp.]
MSGFFSAEGKFFSITSRIIDMVGITFLWIIGCIPIVTILTSTSSMYHTTVKCIRYERGKVFEEFKEAYKKNFKQGVPLTVLYGIIGAVIGFIDYRVFAIMQSRTTAAFILAFGMLILTVLYLINVLWLIPVFSRFTNTFGKIIQLNYVIAVRNIIRCIPMLLILIISVILILASFPLVIIFPSLAMLLISYLSEPGLHKYMPKQEEDNGDWRYGFK